MGMSSWSQNPGSVCIISTIIGQLVRNRCIILPTLVDIICTALLLAFDLSI